MHGIVKKFFISLTGVHFGVSDNNNEEIIGEKELEDFISTGNCLKLYASITEESKMKMCFFSQVPNQCSKLLVFYKIAPTVLTDDNLLSTIQITSISGSPTATLYHSLQNVFSPLLIKQDRKSASHNSIQRQLANLQAGLRNIVLTPTNDSHPIQDVDLNALSIILSLDHEVDYWTNVAKTSKGKDQRASISFRDIIEPLARDFSVLDALPLSDVEDLLENAHNVLDDLWRHDPPYPKARVQYLMDLIATDVTKCISKNLANVNVWTMEFNATTELLEQCITIVNHWASSCKQLTQIFWPNYSLHTWTGDPYVPQSLVDLKNRLQEVLNIRMIHRQLVRLLTASEERELKTETIFVPYENLDILECGPYTESAWNVANKKYEYLLQPAEERVASKLKKQLANTNVSTRQLLYEFKRYTELINRPVVRKTLLNERQYLLSLLKEYLVQLNTQLTADSADSTSKYDTPEVVSEIMKVKQLETKAVEAKTICDKILDDLPGYEDLNQILTQLLKDIKQHHTELFDSWTSEVSQRIKNKTLSLQETDQVVQFSANKLMRVNYSSDLVTLIQEVRQLSVLGYRIPSHIEETATYAKKFMKQANVLQQIANFHNVIGDRMIISQRPMMLASALELSKLVQEQEVVSWNNIDSVEKYINNLNSIVDKLSSENDLLATYHYQIMEKIKTLNDTDLIKYYHLWKDTTKAIREIISQVEGKGFQSTQSWKTEIDQQLYKVLEKQYLKSLDTLHLYLPEIHANLIYRDSQLQLSPSIDSLKEKYQHQVKQFLDIPKGFRGVNSSSDQNIFAPIIENNQHALETVNEHRDEVIEQLNGVVKHWQSWLTLGALDVSQLTTWEHWELHFRASKTFGQEIAKLPSTEERVGCFIVGLSWLRSDLEAHNRTYWSQLSLSLKDSIAQDVFKLQEYVDTSTATLNKQPLTVDQIGESDASYSDILNQKSQMEGLYQEMMRKSKMLSSWTRERVDSVNRLKGAWERLQNLLENYEHIIAKQMETMKATVQIASENLLNDMERFAAKWEQIKKKSQSGQMSGQSLTQLQKHLEDIKEKSDQMNYLCSRKEKLTTDVARFNLEPVTFTMFDQIEEDIKREEEQWLLFEEFYSEIEKFSSEEWIVFRKKSYRLDEFLGNWQNKLELSDNSPVVTVILQEINKYQGILPVLKYIRGEDFTENHWVEVFTLINIAPKPIDILFLRDFLDASDKLIENAQQLQAVSRKAASEVVVRQALAELDHWDVQCRFLLTEHQDCNGTTVMLIKDFKEILNKIGDNQSLLQSVKNSSNYTTFSERSELWETRLTDLEEYLTTLAQVQRKWVYLEPIFGGGALGQEKSRFSRLDKDFKHLLQYIKNDVKVTSLTRYPNLRSILTNLQDQLSRCQNSLDDFLEEKRSKFPRFLFLGDDDLLEIVGQCSKEQVIQSHLKKIFAGIHSIKLDGGGKNIVAMCSLQDEIVPLNRLVNIDQPVENWLNVLVKEMQDSLRSLFVQCLSDGESADPLKYPSQILCLADSVRFTTKCEQAMGNMALKQLLANYKAQLNHYSSLNFNESKDGSSLDSINTDGDSELIEIKLKSLLLDTIHHISVIEGLIENNVIKVNDWNWQKQLRYYSDKSGNITLKMANAEMEYSYEYLGNQAKLVRTPLTDKCFLTLVQGMYLGMGGNPYGPAGTGKTESVKALGGLLGRQVLVFNCDEGIDGASMGKILSGLVRCGAWGCFDEFNRLDETTLSAVSMQIQPIQNALRLHQTTLNLLDREIEVDKHCGIFITLNPAGANYGGRNKLPDGLKQLFRPVVMTHPDHEQIATTLLHCDGYKHAALISRKLLEVFTCASKLLSKQQHYDWGLRSIKTVLNNCGKNIRSYFKISSSITLETELELAIKSLRVDILSKLTYADRIKFENLINDIFPGTSAENFADDVLTAALEKSCADLNLEINSRQIAKCVELYQQLKQRMGVAIVGPPKSGKTTLRKLLFHALTHMGKLMKQHIFNPKSMPRHVLLGQIDVESRQWSDGVLTMYSLQAAGEPLDVSSWIVCDGDMDPDWVESLNSVLDDNKLLSLPSGWRIQFGPNSNFVFETHDLSYVSPATISRLGIIFLSEEDLGVSNIVSRFLAKQPEDLQGVLGQYISDYFYKAIDWVMTESELVMTTAQVSVALSALFQISNVSSKSEFAVGILYALGGYLPSSLRQVFTEQVFEWLGEPQPPSFFFYYNKEKDMIDYYSAPPSLDVDDAIIDLPLILTPQIRYTLNCLRKWFTEGIEQHFLIVGPRGSAKSLILNYLVKERSDFEIVTIHCSANLAPQYILQKLTQACLVINSSKGRIFKPKKGHLVLYFRRLQLLKNDSWGTNILIAFLQQLIAYNGLFDTNLEWIGVKNITIVCSATTISNLSVRFVSSVHVFNVSPPQQEDVNAIYSLYLPAIIKQQNAIAKHWSSNKIMKMVTMMITVYNEVHNKFNFIEGHYDFSLNELTKWCKGILMYKGDDKDVEEYLLEIVIYEALRLFQDRLVDENHRIQFEDILRDQLKMQWNRGNLLQVCKEHVFVPAPKFVSSPHASLLGKQSVEEWIPLVKKGVTQYEREGDALDVLVIPELVQLTAKVAKALVEPGGNVLLIGVAGVGRKPSVKIISALLSVKLVAPIFSNCSQFNNDLKMAIQHAAVEGEDTFFLLEDSTLNDKKIVDTVSALLCSGEVPGLYTLPELESLAACLKDEASRENYEVSLVDFFSERIKKRLHLVICIESNNSKFSELLTNCPALYTHCNVIWTSEWSKDSLESIPKMLIDSANKSKINKTDVDLVKGFFELHGVVSHNIAIPARFISFVKTYIEIFSDKVNIISKRQSKLQAGVTKLTDAKNVVDELKLKAKEQQEKLSQKQEKANAALDMISSTMKNANTQKHEMENLKQHTEKESVYLAKRKKEIEEELSEVKPLIEAARTAIGNIKAESLSEIRSLRAPPDIIRDILEGVLRLMGTQDTSWNSMKNFLSKRGVKEDIRSFDASRITVENREAVSRLLANRKDSFDPKNAKRASVAAAPLAAWVTANVRYSSVMENIKPLEKEQNKLKQNLAAAEMQLNELSSGLMDVDATVAKLKNQLSTYTKEAAEIEINLNAAQETLNSAEGLINKLNDEYERWKIQLKEFSDELHQLPTNCLLASAFITYLSEESEDNRILILEKWLQVLGVNKFSLEEFLSSEREQLQWQSEGLPADQLSLQNAIIILNMNMTPLFLDPSSIASDWIKTHLKSKTVEVISQDSPKFSTVLELAVRFGKTLIIEEIETISPILLPILRKQFVDRGDRKSVNLNGKLVDYHSDFKLVLSCRNSKLQLPADLAAVVNVVNFTTTHAGLSEQLLMSAIKQDSPELETRRKELLRQREELQEKQYNLQNQLLEDLANASGDILQNKNLMVSLNETKASSSAIATALIESEGLHQKLQEEYNVYKDVSSFGSSLYFAIEEFSTTNVLYSLSVPAFIRLFLNSLPQLKDADQSFGFLERSLIQAVYSYMSRAIFKADRLKFALHLCHKILPREIPNDEWNFFLGNSLVGKTDKAQSVPEWVPESLGRNVGALQSALPSLYGRLQLEKESAWRGFFERNDCEANFPSHCDLREFQKVIVVQVLRRNRLYSAMRQCAQRLMSLQSLNSEIIRFSSIYNETFVGEPILLVTAPGTDPSVEIRELAYDKMDKDQYVEIAMGEGQESKTLAALAEAATQGHWLVLKNLHLVTSWLPILSQNMKSVQLHKSFRLWLITEPHPMFSSVLARSSLKIAYEVPQGIKNNILRTYTSWGASYVEKLNPTGSRLFFILSCIHALLQERRTYIPQGWSKAYEFNDTDFSTAIRLTVELMQSPNIQIQWNYLTGVCSDSVYGGRIENIQDLGILDSYLSQYFVDEALTHRWKPLGMANSLPSYSNFQDYLNAINQLSDRDLPSYFGLPANIQQAWEKTTSSEIISHLRNLNLDKRVSAALVRDELHKKLGPFMMLWKKLNQAQDFIRIPTPSPIIQKSLMENFISEEYCYAVIVVKKIHRSFSILNKLAKGGVQIDAKYFEVANELLLYQTPKIWQKLWKGPEEPTKYLKTVMYKTSKIAAWKESSLETVFERPINLSSLFHPATFLSVFKQDFARRKNIAMDDLMLKTSWRQVMGDGVITITNLLIEGALFEGSNITDCLDNSDSINMTPDCHLSWIAKGRKNEEEKAIKIPLYDTKDREDILAYLEVANNFKENNKWIQAGVAFYITC